MNISVKNSNSRTTIIIQEDDHEYTIVTDEKYDNKGNQHIPSSIIDARGFSNSGMDKLRIIKELSRKGIIIDNS